MMPHNGLRALSCWDELVLVLVSEIVRGTFNYDCYQWIRRKGKPAPREVAPVVVSNHISYIEPIFYFYELFPTIVASESHDSIPFVGTIIRAMQVIYVNRFSPSSRKDAVNEIKDLNTEKGFQR
ncbi:hypothetical protein SLEP1_g57552 [Rubroshorea leprosula]|uniref:Phospholipid/glycerol acyltransferase domain-containing protein n=1 Tax=Rubroshorea leprosula TaxID=152421 RepID=A0AAV5MM10_9ROSI|nr:hypothetical protein SLEP1_g57552 [Rubroshorea leprosula]